MRARPAGTGWRRCGCWAWCCASSRWSFARAQGRGGAGTGGGFWERMVLGGGGGGGGASYWMVYFGISAFIVAGILLGRRRIAERLPAFEILDDVMYKA